jgi:hypothetical protein
MSETAEPFPPPTFFFIRYHLVQMDRSRQRNLPDIDILTQAAAHRQRAAEAARDMESGQWRAETAWGGQLNLAAGPAGRLRFIEI